MEVLALEKLSSIYKRTNKVNEHYKKLSIPRFDINYRTKSNAFIL
jgi:hypothetical protein